MQDPKIAKNCHLGTIAQLCRAISSQLKHVSTIGKKLVKQRYVLHMSSQYGELRPTSGWDRLDSLGHPCKFQRVSRLGSVTARHLVGGVSQTLRRWTEGAKYIFGRATITLGIGPHSSWQKCRMLLCLSRSFGTPYKNPHLLTYLFTFLLTYLLPCLLRFVWT